MFNKKINKVLAVNLALGLSFVGYNLKAVDAKQHGILECMRNNPVKSVLIVLAPFVAAGGSCGAYKGYQYFHVEFYNTREDAEKDLEKIKSEYKKENATVCNVTETSKCKKKATDLITVLKKYVIKLNNDVDNHDKTLVTKDGKTFCQNKEISSPPKKNIFYIAIVNGTGDTEYYVKKRDL
ncbi:MAG: hypothetical protein RsTaC01_0215 [Candidatus Paraimprobicoccus trichonymphae]|uniref:Uncharacterized protein n=1 Tax=Candidatus Paraimprobicoccus trichonymphae TaxID=3033793 RepID=A0AA48HZ95_9FIRM|nr:MAG: hypothetical protein RsTaC01_0215 [Candidatus Paraimprobicoccus trichonymphae]